MTKKILSYSLRWPKLYYWSSINLLYTALMNFNFRGVSVAVALKLMSVTQKLNCQTKLNALNHTKYSPYEMICLTCKDTFA